MTRLMQCYAIILIAFHFSLFPMASCMDCFTPSPTNCCEAPCPSSSHAALLAKPASQNAILELAMTNYFRYHSCPIEDECELECEEDCDELCTSVDIPPSSDTSIDKLEEIVMQLHQMEQALQPHPPVSTPVFTAPQQSLLSPQQPSPQPTFIYQQPPPVFLQQPMAPACMYPSPQPIIIMVPQACAPQPSVCESHGTQTCRKKCVYEEEECDLCLSNAFIDIFPFMFISTKAKEIAEYLLPNGLSEITIAENNTSDISSPWLQVTTPNKSFSSILKIRPQRKEAGLAFNFFTRFSILCTEECNWPERLWLGIFVPFEWVQHSIHLDETVTSTSTLVPAPFPNATTAFNNPTWDFGKLSCKPLTKFGVADIYVKLGYDFLLNKRNHLALFGALFIPTSSGLKSHYLFEPTIGNLGHVGLGFGLNGDWCLWRKGDISSVNWMTDLRYAYFFSRKEIRSTDIFTSDWSRYLLVAKPTALGTPLPGINFLTQKLDITPRSTANIWTALHIAHCNFHLEFGYNFWWRQQETFDHFKAPGVVIYDINGTPGAQTSASNALISAAEPGTDGPVSNTVPVLISTEMLSVTAPIIPNITVNSFYASLGGQCLHNCNPLFVTAGLYYDLSDNNHGLSGFGSWLKISIGF